MTEKRFYLMNVEDPLHEYGRWCKPVLEDGETMKQYENALEVMDLLNEQNDDIGMLKSKLEDCEFAHRTEMAHHRVIEKDLKKENEQLKSRVEYLKRKIDRERTSYQKQHEKWEEEIQKENEQLKQFKNKTFDLLDKEITRNEEAIEWGKETGADSGSVGFYNHMLKILRKELQE